MKITKLSLAAIAAMTLTTGAMAEVTMDLSGNAKIWYETADVEGGVSNGLFDYESTSGFSTIDAAASIEAKGKAGVFGYGFKYTAVDTLGMENNVAKYRRQLGASGNEFGTAHWAEKAFLTYKVGNTLTKVGRQHLNTPLAFTEKWNVSANSFNAAVVTNSDIENVTLLATYIGQGNGDANPSLNPDLGGPPVAGFIGFSTVTANGQFRDFGTNRYFIAGAPNFIKLNGSGAYAAAALVKPMPGLDVNAWYYNVQDIADAIWVDANYKFSGVNLGAIYSTVMPKSTVNNGTDLSAFADTTALAVKASSKVGPVTLFAAYSTVDNVSGKLALPVGNFATGFKKTKLPTAGVYNDGLIIAQPGADTFKLKAAMPVGGVKLVAQYISTTNENDTAASGSLSGKSVDEINLIAATKFADVTVKAIYINRKFDNPLNKGIVLRTDSDHVRLIAGINF